MLKTNDLNHILNLTRDLWDEQCVQEIFITSGTGFFGCWFGGSFLRANQKLDLKARVLILDCRPTYRNVPAAYRQIAQNADFVMNQVFWIGVYPGLTRPMLDYICKSLHEFSEIKR